MRTNLTIRALILFLLAASLYMGCKKIDHVQSRQYFKTPQDRFFALSGAADPLVSGLVRKMERDEEQKPYVSDLIRWAGYPDWDHVKTLSTEFANRLVNGAGVALIPFAKEGESKTSAIVIARVSRTDTVLSIVYYYQYRLLPYQAPSSSGLTAEQSALLFMAFDRDRYGDSSFLITDSLLFHYAHSPRPGRNVGIKNVSEGRSSIEICFDVFDNDCTPPPAQQPPVTQGCGGIAKLLGSTCIVIDFSGGGNGDGFPGTGNTGDGGSPGGGGWTDNPCRNSAAAGADPCQGNNGPGWVPVVAPEPSADPCSQSDRSAGATADLFYFLNSGSASMFDPFDSTGTQNEQYLVVNEINGTEVPGAIQNLSTYGGSMVGVSAATRVVFHTHPAGGYPFPSAADFAGMAQFSPSFHAHYVIAYDGTKYAMIVNSYSQLQAFIAANPDLVNNATAGFNTNNSVGTEWRNLVSSLLVQGYSGDEARERALAFIMAQAGVTLTKASANSSTFKKVGLREKIVNGVPVCAPNGQPLYENADCP